MYTLARTDAEIDEQRDKADEGVAHGTRVGGMSYEEGVDATIRWMVGESSDAPMDD